MPTKSDNSVIPIPAKVQEAWSATLKELEGKIPRQHFSTFILTIKLTEYSNEKLMLGLPNEFYRNWTVSQYAKLIKETFTKAYEQTVQIEFCIDTKSTLKPGKPNSKSAAQKAGLRPVQVPARPLLRSGNRLLGEVPA